MGSEVLTHTQGWSALLLPHGKVYLARVHKPGLEPLLPSEGELVLQEGFRRRQQFGMKSQRKQQLSEVMGTEAVLGSSSPWAVANFNCPMVNLSAHDSQAFWDQGRSQHPGKG